VFLYGELCLFILLNSSDEYGSRQSLIPLHNQIFGIQRFVILQ